MLNTCREHGYAPPRVEAALRLLEGMLAGRDAVSLQAARSVQGQPHLVWRPLGADPLSWRTSLVWRAGATTRLKRRVSLLTSAALKRWEDWQPPKVAHAHATASQQPVSLQNQSTPRERPTPDPRLGRAG